MPHSDHPTPTARTYLTVYLALMALLAATVGAAFIPWGAAGHWGAAIALSIAVAKGLLVLLYFMHVRYGPRPLRAFAAAGFLWLAILFTLTFGDYLTRNNPPGVNPRGEPRYLDPPP